jgi:His-Xaa-Ser system radical SAM maturase HxsB
MGFTYSTDFKEYAVNEFLWKKIAEDKILVTTRHGGWAILDENEFKLLFYGKVEEDSNLYHLLEKEGIILTKDNSLLLIKKYREKFRQLFEATNLHIITPTLRCNHKCIYCYANAKSLKGRFHDMDMPTAKAVVDFIFQCPSQFLTIEFQGGEPFLTFDILQFIVTYAKQKAKKMKKYVRFNLVTNLTVMDMDKIRWITKEGIRLCSSLDGPREVHDKNRRYENGKSSYEDVIYWYKELKNRGIRVDLMPTISRYSLPYAKEIVNEYVRLGQKNFWARRLNVGGFAKLHWKKIGYTAEEFLDFWRRCLAYILKLNKKGIRICEETTAIFMRNIIFSKQYHSFVCLASPCGCAWGQTAYLPNGDIYTCDEAKSFEIFKIGNVKNTSYQELYSDWKVLDMVDLSSGLSFDCSSCIYNPFCGPCLVDEFGEHGNIIKRTGSFNCKIKKGIFEHIFKEIILKKENLEIVKKWLKEWGLK